MSGQAQHEYTASLRVFSESLSLSELVAALGEPSDGYDIGDLVSHGRPHGPKRLHARWGLNSHAERTQPLDEHVRELVEFIEGHQAALNAVRDRVDVDIFCGVFTADDAQGGFTLQPGLLRRLSDLQLAVIFDVY